MRELDLCKLDELKKKVMPFIADKEQSRSFHQSIFLTTLDISNVNGSLFMFVEMDGILTCRLSRLGEGNFGGYYLKRDAMQFIRDVSVGYSVYLLASQIFFNHKGFAKIYSVLSSCGAKGVISYEKNTVNDYRLVMSQLCSDAISQVVLLKAIGYDLRSDAQIMAYIKDSKHIAASAIIDIFHKSSKLTYYLTRHAYFDIAAESYTAGTDDELQLINVMKNTSLDAVAASLAKGRHKSCKKAQESTLKAIEHYLVHERVLQNRSAILKYLLAELKILDTFTGNREFPLIDNQDSRK